MRSVCRPLEYPRRRRPRGARLPATAPRPAAGWRSPVPRYEGHLVRRARSPHPPVRPAGVGPPEANDDPLLVLRQQLGWDSEKVEEILERHAAEKVAHKRGPQNNHNLIDQSGLDNALTGIRCHQVRGGSGRLRQRGSSYHERKQQRQDGDAQFSLVGRQHQDPPVMIASPVP